MKQNLALGCGIALLIGGVSLSNRLAASVLAIPGVVLLVYAVTQISLGGASTMDHGVRRIYMDASASASSASMTTMMTRMNWARW